MQEKVVLIKTKGMARDTSAPSFNAEFAYENKNVRIATNDDNTLLSLVNEKGTKDTGVVVTGTPLGYAVIDNKVILFTHSSIEPPQEDELSEEVVEYKPDYIYSIYKLGDDLATKVLYNNNLNFDTEHPIETLPLYENENAVKVYWVDGKNLPRVINIAKEEFIENLPTLFDFIPTLSLSETCSVERDSMSSGVFSPGTIQYVCTYFNKYGQESNIFWSSSLYYISYNDRGASPEDRCSSTFTLKLKDLDKNFDYVRIYSIHRTSIDTVPAVKRVVDLQIDRAPKKNEADPDIIYTDDGKNGSTIDPTILLYVGGKEIIASTLAQKDNTLFLGNIKGENELLNDDIRSIFRIEDNSLLFALDKEITENETSGIYPYTNHLNLNSSLITTFKYGETYRFGVLLQKSTGEWSEPIFVTDAENTLLPNEGLAANIESGSIKLTQAEASFNITNLPKDYVAIRPLIVYPSTTDRTVIALGVLNPTVFNVKDRATNSPFAQSSWFFRPNLPKELNGKLFTDNLLQSSGWQWDWCLELPPKSNYLLIAVLEQLTIDSIYNIEYYSRDYKETFNNGAKTVEVKIVGTVTTPSDYNHYLYLIGDVLDENKNPTSINRNGDTNVSKVKYFLSGTSRSGNPNNSIKIYKNNPYSGDNLIVAYGELAYDSLAYALEATTKTLSFRPNTTITDEDYIYKCWMFDLYTELKYKVMQLDPPLEDEEEQPAVKFDTIGLPLEFRHFFSLPKNINKACEIQCTNVEMTEPNMSGQTDFINDFSDLFFVDLNIVTFHSPEIEFSTDFIGLNLDNVELKIVGYVPITGTAADIDILTETPALNYRADDNHADRRTVAYGFYKRAVGLPNISSDGYLGLVTSNSWMDELYSSSLNPNSYNNDLKTYGFPVYPWHRSGSLNNQSYDSKNPKDTESTTTNYRSAKLKTKKMSNLRFSVKPIYFEDSSSYSLSGLLTVTSDQMVNTRISVDGNGTSGNLNAKPRSVNYYGNIDKLLTCMRSWKVTNGYVGLGRDSKTYVGYRLAASYPSSPTDLNTIYSNNLTFVDLYASNKIEYRDAFSTDPIRIKYKSSPHIVLSLKGDIVATADDGVWHNLKVLPSLNGINKVKSKDTDNPNLDFYIKAFWDELYYHMDLENILLGEKHSKYGWLWLAELRRTNVSNKFGGQTKDAFENNNWLVGGPSVKFEGDTVEVVWTEGDTYFQRYDCLKTYPFTLEDPNSIVDILSFMCETRINLDGRYDRNRGQVNNLVMLPSNFNLMNEVYSLRNNFFNYRMLDTDLFNFESYPYTVTWTKTKALGEKVDTWTNITLASTMDLDGNKGQVTALRRLNDNLIAFQERALSLILYNELMLISTLEGVPIEISNSNKVTGKRYISDRIGCINKWSICESPNGIYFIDDYNKGIYLYNGLSTPVNLSDVNNFHTWMSGQCTRDVWNPESFNNMASYYEPNNSEVLFINKDECLAFNEGIGTFTSFYDYNNTPYLINLLGSSYWFRKNGEDSYKIWEHNKGHYNMYFGEFKPFWTTVIVNPNPTTDKVFTTLDFRSDSWSSSGKHLPNITYDTLNTWNEYQRGYSNLLDKEEKPTNLKKKFRVWRALLPRNNGKLDYSTEAVRGKTNRVPRDRMRNPWLYLQLKRNTPNTFKTVLHDMVVHYFE